MDKLSEDTLNGLVNSTEVAMLKIREALVNGEKK